MKKGIISILAGASLLTLISVSAEEVTSSQAGVTAVPIMATITTTTNVPDVVVPSIEVPSSVGSVTEKAEVIGVKSLARIQARGAQLIKERVRSLNENAQAVASSKALTPEQKMAFAAFFSGTVNDLNTLGTKIAASTDASSSKVLVESIFTDFRIYGVLLPQVRLQKRIYEAQNHIVKLNETFPKLQAKIDEQKGKGKDVATWQASLDYAKLMVATDTVKLTALMTQISALRPADYGTTSKNTIESVNKGVRDVVKDLNIISSKIRKPAYLKNMPKAMNATSTMKMDR